MARLLPPSRPLRLPASPDRRVASPHHSHPPSRTHLMVATLPTHCRLAQALCREFWEWCRLHPDNDGVLEAGRLLQRFREQSAGLGSKREEPSTGDGDGEDQVVRTQLPEGDQREGLQVRRKSSRCRSAHMVQQEDGDVVDAAAGQGTASLDVTLETACKACTTGAHIKHTCGRQVDHAKQPQRMVHSEFKQQPPTEPKRLRRPTEKVAASVHLSPMRNHPSGDAGGSSKRRRKADQTYQVEKIIAERTRNGGTEFQVCWLGYSRDHDSWEPETNVSTHTCQTFFPTYLVCVVSLDIFLHRICPHPIQIQILDPGLISAFRGEVFAPLLAPLLAPKRVLVRSVRRAAITIGTEAQACIQPSIESVRPPPAEPPRCPCNHPAKWGFGRWWCESGACAYECEPPPFALTPSCACDRPCIWHHGRWWCELGDAGCGFEQRESRPYPKRVCSSISRRIVPASIEAILAMSTASLLTHAAYGLEEWSFVAPTDCGLGLFARGKIEMHQVISEYGGPHLPLRCLKQSTYAFEIPHTSECKIVRTLVELSTSQTARVHSQTSLSTGTVTTRRLGCRNPLRTPSSPTTRVCTPTARWRCKSSETGVRSRPLSLTTRFFLLQPSLLMQAQRFALTMRRGRKISTGKAARRRRHQSGVMSDSCHPLCLQRNGNSPRRPGSSTRHLKCRWWHCRGMDPQVAMRGCSAWYRCCSTAILPIGRSLQRTFPVAAARTAVIAGGRSAANPFTQMHRRHACNACLLRLPRLDLLNIVPSHCGHTALWSCGGICICIS